MESNCLDLDRVILAADYLGIKSLVGLCCQRIADLITACKTPSEIRYKFNIISDFTPKEQEDVCRENQWAFEAKDVPFSLNNGYPLNILCLRGILRCGQDPRSIHDDLIVDIFTRMPAKSLARCRCVSRAWASIIRRPSFSALFSSRRKPQLLFACREQETNDCKDDGKLFFLSSPLPQALEDFSSDLEVNHQTELSLLRGEVETDISVNGLVFGIQEQPVHRKIRGPGKCLCVIHNPGTGKSIAFPELCPVVRCTLEHTPGVLGTQTYFGYDPIDKVYKALSMTTTTNGIVRDHHCLKVRGGKYVLWRSIKCCIEHFLHIDRNQVCINGHIFYPAADRLKGKISMVIDFDVNSEKFTSIKYFDTQLHRTLFDFNGKLGSYVPVDHMKSFELWVLDDAVNQSWSKQFHVLPNLGADCNSLFMRFAGVTHRNETVWLPLIHDTGPLFVWFYNTHTKTVKKICLKSSSVFEGKKFRTFVNHIECLKTPWEEFKGVAVLESSEGVNGTIVFTQEGEEGVTTMTVTVSGLNPGPHRISIHNVDMKEFHVGNDGTATFTTGDDDYQISLTEPNSISGRSVILRADGRVVAQGDIGLQD